jgi:hypothetical protein
VLFLCPKINNFLIPKTMNDTQDMREIWNEITIPTLVKEEKKKKVIQEIMHDDIPSEKQELKE